MENLNFSDYGKLQLDDKRIAKLLGYSFSRKVLELERPLSVQKSTFWRAVKDLQEKTFHRLQSLSLDSEAIKREVLIAPILLLLLDELDIVFAAEYQLNVNESLKGKLDYFIENDNNIVVIEAKKDDFEAGTRQLIAEMVAVSIAKDSDTVYGAISNGRIWQFQVLDRPMAEIVQDINLYNFPQEAEKLFRILLAMLITEK